jgi:Ca-activated chloride channel family protein
MIHVEWPLLLLALPLPLLVRWFMPPQSVATDAALKMPFIEELGQVSHVSMASTKQWALWVGSIAWVLLVLATCRPQWLGEPIEQAVSGRDLMLAIDVSGSMDEHDFFINDEPVDRLTATKQVATAFINRRLGDRLGLILFGTTAYLQTPLTFDRKTVSTLLDEAFIGITDDEPATSIGDAIGLAVKRLKDEKQNSRVLILLTDGANTAGEISPLQAAQLAADINLKIYTIGVGADEKIVRSFFGNRRVNPSRDLDEKTLTTIAELTEGRYFRARNQEELDGIYKLLDLLEPVEKDKQYYRPMKELYPWPLGGALVLMTVLALFRLRRS